MTATITPPIIVTTHGFENSRPTGPIPLEMLLATVALHHQSLCPCKRHLTGYVATVWSVLWPPHRGPAAVPRRCARLAKRSSIPEVTEGCEVEPGPCQEGFEQAW